MYDSLSKIPDGMRYLTGAEARKRRAIENRVMEIFTAHGYEELICPTLDYYALFERGMGAEAAARAFRLTDADNSLIALRPDVTSSIARAAATLLNSKPRPLRLCYAANVWHTASRSAAEWTREDKHLGCELIGTADDGTGRLAADAEMLSLIGKVIKDLKLETRTRITLNNIQIFNGIAERLNLDVGEREQLRYAMDTRDTAHLKDFLNARTDDTHDIEAFAKLVRLTGKAEIIAQARRVITNQKSVDGLNELAQLYQQLASLPTSEMFEIDLGDASQLDYYTGLVFKIYIHGTRGRRAGGGGRYDELIAAFGKNETAVGFMLDLDALVEAARADAV